MLQIVLIKSISRIVLLKKNNIYIFLFQFSGGYNYCTKGGDQKVSQAISVSCARKTHVQGTTYVKTYES